nr:SRPBCC domain-containing protein [Streptomyces sp. HNM0574]
MDVMERIGREVVSCAVGDGEEGRRLTVRAEVAAPVERVLRACAEPEELAAWLAPVAGELREGGDFAVEGNAHGTVLACGPDGDGRLIRLTWLYGEQAVTSELTVRLAPAADGGTQVTLDHLATHDPENWDDFGPAAAGVGWDLILLGLTLHLRGEPVTDPETWQTSAEATAVKRASVLGWAAALAEWGAGEEHLIHATNNSLGFYLSAGAPPAEADA